MTDTAGESLLCAEEQGDAFQAGLLYLVWAEANISVHDAVEFFNWWVTF